MMKLLIAACVVAVVLAEPLALSNEEYQFQFTEFMTKHNKQYSGVGELFKRFNIFKEMLDFVRVHNAGNHSWMAGINEFSDLTNAEFRKTLTGCAVADVQNFVPEVTEGWVANPANNVDWRGKKSTAVKNQGSCGSCWAFGAIGTLEGLVANRGGGLHTLSEQQLVDCAGSQGNHGCNGGMPDRALRYAASAGVCASGAYPYTGRDGACRSCSGTKVKFSGPRTGSGENTLVSALNAYPVSVAIDASSQFQAYKSGTFSGSCSSTSINHAVLAVGYTPQYWIVKNSWGTSWGQGGHIYMARGRNTCNINSYLAWAV